MRRDNNLIRFEKQRHAVEQHTTMVWNECEQLESEAASLWGMNSLLVKLDRKLEASSRPLNI